MKKSTCGSQKKVAKRFKAKAPSLGSKTSTHELAPKNLEEKLVWYAITGTWFFYLVGGLYLLGPALAWILFSILIKQHYFQALGQQQKIIIPLGVWVWIFGMLLMEIALIAGHLQWELGTGKLIKSSIGWAKGWALMALFPLAGCLNIRAAIIYRACAILCKQTLYLMPFLLLAGLLHLPADLYVSPMKLLGGPSDDFFTVSLYGLGPDGGLRWRLFAPWGPALGFLGNIYFIFALTQKGSRYFWPALLGAIVMIVVCKSRLAMVSLLVVSLLNWGICNLFRAKLMFMAAMTSVAGSLLFTPILLQAQSFIEQFKAVRADSSRVRSALGRIALDRWQSEAPIWGHGIVERGPHLVEHMPIGSHHTWYGLLFIKGFVGFIALFIPMIWSLVELAIKAPSNPTAKVALSMVLILWLYTFGENLEMLAYLYWPALMVIGMAMKQPLKKGERK